MNIVLWVIQGLLALAFLMAGFMKAFMPKANLEKNMAWVKATPAALVRFIGAAEILGAIGLIVPAITGIASWLTIAAAGGLAIVMLAAAGYHASRHENSNIGMNVVLLLLAAVIIVGRLSFAPAYF